MPNHNHTEFTLEEIRKQPVLKCIHSKWRRRTIILHEHPTDKEQVISVGIPWNATDVHIICDDHKSAWTVELSNPSDTVTTE